jgi:hypothetical protein
MAIGGDRVQLTKLESTAKGGDSADAGPYESPQPIDPQEDAIEAAGIYLQDASAQDETTYVARAGDDLIFRDVTTGATKTLTELIAGTGALTEAAHRTLRQLIHFIGDGPAEGFASGAYKETLPAGSIFPTSEVWWESASKLKKIVSLDTTWTGVNITAEVWKVYDTDGSTVLATVTDAISYTGIFETDRTRTIA